MSFVFFVVGPPPNKLTSDKLKSTDWHILKTLHYHSDTDAVDTTEEITEDIARAEDTYAPTKHTPGK